MKKLLILIPLALLFSRCEKSIDYNSRDKEIIEKYLTDNQLSALSTPSGLYYIIDVPGDADNHPGINSMVYVKYKGYLTDGTVFDQTTGNNYAKFYLYQVIKGWQEGIPLFGKGGKGKLLIPSELGYGAKAITGIPAHSVLIFDIELVNVFN